MDTTTDTKNPVGLFGVMARFEQLTEQSLGSLPVDHLSDAYEDMLRCATETEAYSLLDRHLTTAGISSRVGVRAWMNWERDLIRCPLLPGDLVEVLVDRPSSAPMSKGTMAVVIETDPGTAGLITVRPVDRPGDRWCVLRAAIRLHGPAVPTIPEGWSTAATGFADRMIRWTNETGPTWPTNGRHIWESVNECVRTNWPDFAFTPEGASARGKDFVGRCMKARNWNATFGPMVTSDVFTMTDATVSTPVEEVRTPAHELALARITELEARIAQAQADRDTYREDLRRQQAHHREDVDTISKRLMREAEQRNWCSEYDQIVSDLNSDLHVEMEVREEEYEVTVTGYVTIPFTHSITVTMPRGSDSDDIVSEAQEVWNNISASDLDYDTYNAEVNDEPDFEVE